MAEFAKIIGGTSGEFMISLSPHIFGGIEFGRVRREIVHIESGMIGEES